MDEKARLHRILDALRPFLPSGQFFVNGSGAMVLHGIQREKMMGDVDIFLAARPWMELAQSYEMIEVDPERGTWRSWTTDPTEPVRAYDPPYLVKELMGLEVNIFPSWRTRGIGDQDINALAREVTLVEGWPCVNLMTLLEWKEQMGRDKDLSDIRLLREFLGVRRG